MTAPPAATIDDKDLGEHRSVISRADDPVLRVQMGQ
jgi:hypothetical protein